MAHYAESWLNVSPNHVEDSCFNPGSCNFAWTAGSSNWWQGPSPGRRLGCPEAVRKPLRGDLSELPCPFGQGQNF